MDNKYKRNEEEYILIDSSFISSAENISLPRALYSGNEGLYLIDEDMINRRMSKIGELNALLNRSGNCVIEEVVTEMTSLLSIINQQQNFIEIHIGKKSLNRHKKSMPETDMPASTQHDLIWRVKAYSNVLYRVIRKMNNRDPRKRFTHLQKQTYLTFLDIARAYSIDLIREGVDNASKIKKAQMLGIELETDQKITAVACSLAYTRPVSVYSKDRGILEIFNRLAANLSQKLHRREFGLEMLPSNPICYFNPNVSNTPARIRFHYSPQVTSYVA